MKLHITILDRYITKQFFSILFLCLFSAISLFIVIDLFERLKTFVKADATLLQVLGYITFKIPMMLQMMMPIGVLLAVLIAVGRLSQLSEVTAMRACGGSLMYIARGPLLAGFAISLFMFVFSETIVPWSTEKYDEIYHLDIRKRQESGSYSKSNFWYRNSNRFYKVGFYDSRLMTLSRFSFYEFDKQFLPVRRVDSAIVNWHGPSVGWIMEDVVEKRFAENGLVHFAKYKTLPLVINEGPEDFYKKKKKPETLNIAELYEYINKLKREGVPSDKYLVDLIAKTSFPFLSFIVVLVGFPFSLASARSGTMTVSFLAGAVIGFSYYVIHALLMSFGAGQLVPVIPAAWGANLIFICIGGYLMAGAEEAS